MKSESRELLSCLAIHVSAQSLGATNWKQPLAAEYLQRMNRWYPWQLPTRLCFPGGLLCCMATWSWCCLHWHISDRLANGQDCIFTQLLSSNMTKNSKIPMRWQRTFMARLFSDHKKYLVTFLSLLTNSLPPTRLPCCSDVASVL